MGVIYSIKQFLFRKGNNSDGWRMAYYRGKYFTAKFLNLIMGEKKYAQWFYRQYTGKKLNLSTPRTLGDKLWWLKLNNRDPQTTVCSDKIAVRDYVASAGYAENLIPLLDTFTSVKELRMEKYTKEVVVKCNHNSGGHFFYSPGVTTEDQTKKAKKRLRYILKQTPYILSREWNYKNIEPRLIVEEVKRDSAGKLPLDYKFMCFNGEPKVLFLNLGMLQNDSSYNPNFAKNAYDMDWNLLPITDEQPNSEYTVKKPENFEFMVQMARKLSAPFAYCRVDLYNIDGHVYFGEITFFHNGGCCKIEPAEWDLKMASWIDLNSSKIVRRK